MLYISRLILLLICLAILPANTAFAQQKKESAGCNNQLIYPNADFNNFESPVTGKIKQIQEQETDLADGVQSDLVQTTNYDEQGKITDTFLTNSKIKVFGKTIYSYDEKNRLIREVLYNPDGSAVTEDVLSYDFVGNLKQILTQNVKTKAAMWKKDFSYDAKKNYSEYTDSLRGYGLGFVKDAKCRITETISYKSVRTVTSRVSIVYDDKNNTVEQTVYNPEGKIIGRKKSEFEFDNRGNWIKEKRFELAVIEGRPVYQPVTMITRKITYFDAK